MSYEELCEKYVELLRDYILIKYGIVMPKPKKGKK